MKDVLGDDDAAGADKDFVLDVLHVVDHPPERAGALGLHVDTIRLAVGALGLRMALAEPAATVGLPGLGVDLFHIIAIFVKSIVVMFKHSLSYHHKALDITLEMFDEQPTGFISNELLLSKDFPHPADQDEVLSCLVAEGLLEQTERGFKITYKGRMVIHNGGFEKAERRRRMMSTCTIIAAVAAVIGVILQILFQVLG